MQLSRRQFIQQAAVVTGAIGLGPPAFTQTRDAPAGPAAGAARGAIVLCNHWTQFGIGETFPAGELRERWYRQTFSVVFGMEQGRRWLEMDARNRFCHELDAYSLDALAAEDPDYLATIRRLLDSARMELPGGTYGQAESQVFGYESALRQLTFGQEAYRRHLQRSVDTFIVEEQCFFPQLPQLLKLAGFKHASIQFQNSGTPDPSPHDIILWESPDGTAIPTIPNHPGMVPCTRQMEPYDEVVTRLEGRRAPLVFQWLEIWPPGLDWGASVAPYADAVHALEGQGFRQMLLSEYIGWALGRSDAPRIRIPMDQSNYNNNFFLGGWGYENEKTARASNHCEALLLAAEALCAGRASGISRKLGGRLHALWSRLLVSQNHDPYLAGSVPAYVDGVQSLQSELAVKQLGLIEREFQQADLDAPLPRTGGRYRMFNPCPWDVKVPLLLELDEPVWPQHPFRLKAAGRDVSLAAVFRSDNGNVLVGPVMASLPPYGTFDGHLEPIKQALAERQAGRELLTSENDGRLWKASLDFFEGIEFEPLIGKWQQVSSYFIPKHPNINVEVAYPNIEQAPVSRLSRSEADGMELTAWTRDLMRIREVEQSALSVQAMAIAGEEPTAFVQFNHRLAATIRFQTGRRPGGTWRFRIRVPGEGLKVFADSPFCEEERKAENFYCSRYIRLQWPGRHLLWCTSQNTRFRRITEGNSAVVECTVFDFSFSGTANWEMRFHAGSSFSAAESMRLAETFHRKPIRIPANVAAEGVAGIRTDNQAVLINHVFPVDGRSVGVRVLNASAEAQGGTVFWPKRFEGVVLADLAGRKLQHGWAQPGKGDHWEYQFRPWEITTFRVG